MLGRSTGAFSTGFFFFVTCFVAACGGRVGDGEGSAAPPSPLPSTTATSVPPSPSDGGAPSRRVTCKPGETTLGTFAGERPIAIVVSVDTGALLASTRTASGAARFRVLRDATKGLEELATLDKASGALAASSTHLAFAADSGAMVLALQGAGQGAAQPLATAEGSPTFIGLRDKELVAVHGAKVSRHPLSGGAASQVCLGSTCTVPGIVAFAARGSSMALVDTERALYTGTDVGLRKVAGSAKGPLAMGAAFVAFVVENPNAPSTPSLGLFRPLEEDVELFPLPATKGKGCAPSAVEARSLASDGARLAFATKESYPCGDSDQAVAFASRASQPQAGTELPGAKGAVAIASDETCIYALVERTQGGSFDTQLVSIESRAR